MRQGAGCLFTDGEKVLVLKRSEAVDEPNTWGLPGGGVNFGETKLDAAKRECKEEIGLFPSDAVIIKPIPEGDWTTYIYKVKSPFNVKLNPEHSDWEWVKLDELKDLELHPGFRKNLGRYSKIIKTSLEENFSFKEFFTSSHSNTLSAFS